MSQHPDHEPDTAAIGRAIQAAARTVEAPPHLRERLEAQRPAARARGGRAGGWSRWRPAIALGLATAIVAVALAVIGLPGGGPGTPSLGEAAALALSRPTQPAPPARRDDPSAIQAAVEGISFPNVGWHWSSWHTAGARDDRLAGRDARTVVYRGPTGDVGYTIVAGDALPVPAGARRMTVHGVRFAVLHRGRATVVTWQHDGHTCIVAGRGADLDKLMSFATWT